MTFSARFFAAALLVVAAAPAQAQTTPLADMPAGIYTADPTHTSVTWKVSHIGLSKYTARFAKANAELHLDPADPVKSTLKASVDPASIRTDYPKPEEKDFDHKLATDAEWFNADKFPEITFTSTRLEKTGETTGRMTGDLTFLGVTKPVTFDVTFNGAYAKAPFSEVPALGFSARAVIKRSDWGFSTYVPNIGDEVEILIETEMHKKG
jgi:polyisoprenoid-binding protein YceI